MGAEEPDRKEREGTINKAYCFETDSIDGPFLAVEKRAAAIARGTRLHYFCPTEDCAYPMKGPALKRREEYNIAYFESKRRGTDTPPNHVPQCPFVIAERKSKARGESQPPTYTPFQPPPLFIPEVLVDNIQDFQRTWDEDVPPSRDALVTMITNAESRPVQGSIEDVMAAERVMARAYRAHKKSEGAIPPPEHKKWEKRLIIGDNHTTYQDGIVHYADAVEHLGDSEFWRSHIVWFTGKPKRDPEGNGGFYLNFAKLPFAIWVDGTLAKTLPTKAYVPDLFERQVAAGGLIHCHFWGLEPLESKRGQIYLRLKNADALMQVGFIAPPQDDLN